MNTKIRVLSFLTALMMVIGIMAVLPITVNAADANGSVSRSVDIRKVYEFLRDNDYESYKDVLDYYKRVEYIPHTDTPPALDGAIGASEYTVTNPIIISTYNTTHKKMGQSSGSKNLPRTIRYANEYFAQDEDYVYFAFVLPNISHYLSVPYFYFDIRVDYSDYTTGSNRNAMQERLNAYALQIQVNTSTGAVSIANNGSSSCANKMDMSKWTQTAANTVKYTAPTAQDTNGYVEYKISKSQLMEVMKVTHLKDLSYGLVYWSKSGGTQQCNFIANMSDVSAANIKSIADASWFAVYRNVGIADMSTYDDNGYAAGGNSSFNVREDLEAHGFKSYTVNGFASPVADGVINTNEYTLVENNSSSDKKNNGTDYDLVEYFAHDEDYVYYAFTAPYVASEYDAETQEITNDSTDRIHIGLKSATGTKAGDNYFNSYKLSCNAAEDAADSTFNADGEINTSGGYASHSSGFVKEDFELVGKIDTEADTVTYELRIDRAKLAAAAGTAELDHYAYYVAFGQKWNCYNLNEGTDYALEKIQFVESALETTRLGKNVFLVDPDFQTNNVASIRIDEYEKSGLRFQTIVSKTYLAKLEAEGYRVKAGTLIAPDDTLDAKLTHKTGVVGVDYLDVVANLGSPYDTSDKYITFTGAIVNIKSGNLDRKFTAVGYLALTKNGNTEYVYADEVSKSVSEVASAAIASGKYNDDADALTILNALVAANRECV